MKNLKKYLTFTNILALFSFIVLMLFFTPCFTLYTHEGKTEPDHLLNLFNVTFGCKVPLPGYNASYSDPIKFLPCAGLILAFIFVILGIIASIGKNKIKLLGFAASAFYITSGVLVACAVPMILHTNYESLSQMTYKVGYYGWAIAIATLLCFSGLCAFIDAVAGFAKPKVQEVY